MGAAPARSPFAGAVPPGTPQSVIGPRVVVELELRPGAVPDAAKLGVSPATFLGNSAPGANTAAPDSGLRAVLSSLGLVDARPVFSAEQITADEEHRRPTRTLSGSGDLAPAQASALERTPPLGNFVRISFPAGTNATEVLRALRASPEVAQAVPVPDALPPTVAPSFPALTDPLIGAFGDGVTPDAQTGLERQWYLHRTRVPEAWSLSRGRGVVIADIDWGFRTTHQDLGTNLDLARSYNAVDGGQDIGFGPAISHGTAVTGIAAGAGNGKGIAGYAPEATLWLIQANDAPGPRKAEEPWASAIEYVRTADSGGKRKVIILEVQTGAYGNYEQVPSVNAAIRRAIASNCVVCVAAGNGDRPADVNDRGEPIPPTGSILVGATAFAGTSNPRAGFSNYGSRVVVSAPGDPAHDITCGAAADNAYTEPVRRNIRSHA